MNPPNRHPGGDRSRAGFARHLRREQTDAERLLWSRLRNRRVTGAKLRRQHPVPPYVLDFFCREIGLAIELDGGQHGENDGEAHDREQTAQLASRGIRVLRFWNHEVLGDMDMVLVNVYRTIEELRATERRKG